MKILITGGAGFIGSHLVRQLLKEGNQVVVIDNLTSSKLSNLPKHPKLKFVKKSILDNIGRYFLGVETVFHLAALTRPQESIQDPIGFNKVNVEGTLKVLIRSQTNRVKRFIFISSSSIYGDTKQIPTTEQAIPQPLSPYGAQKLIGEQYCYLFSRLYGLEVNCIRPFNVYGPRQSTTGYANAIPKFISLLDLGKPPTIWGDGKQARDFIYVEDLVRLLILAASSKTVGEPFNAGTGKTVTVNNLCQTISKLMKKDIKPIFGPKVIEPRLNQADISKAQKLLGWTPQVSLLDGLTETINSLTNLKT